MSELIQKHDNRATIRWKLLTGASALALTAYVSSASMAGAEDAGQPQIWIELGGQLNRLEDGQELFAPPLFDARPSIFSSSDKFEKPPLFGFDESGKISFQPHDSDWVLSASVRYGRSASKRHVHQQSYPKRHDLYFTYGGQNFVSYWSPYADRFADTRSQNSERHLIVDFQAGKDVGLGMFGSTEGTSVISAGVRFAHFSSKSNIAIKSDPDWHFVYGYYPSYITYFNATNTKVVLSQPYHSNWASLRAARSFRGVGPSISWNASLPFAGNSQDGELTFDWGLNAAALFGRQMTKTSHQTTARSGHGGFHPHPITLYKTSTSHTRSRNLTVPNVGGFAGLSFRYTDVKFSVGYRADFFFGAMDGGIDTRKTENVGFNGPYASISIGLGD